MQNVTLKPGLCHSFDSSVSLRMQWEIWSHLITERWMCSHVWASALFTDKEIL